MDGPALLHRNPHLPATLKRDARHLRTPLLLLASLPLVPLALLLALPIACANLWIHGSPRRVNEFLWESATPDGLVRHFLESHKADVILCSHTGIKWHRALPEDRHLVNVGVIGRPENDGTPRVWYTILTAGTGLEVEFVPLAYDHEALAREMEAEQLPREFIETIRTGWWTTCLENLPARERQRSRF
jgi:diadenosine tetraphosphatase ApaH/serine/threonine PP2A family protein phosphatase